MDLATFAGVNACQFVRGRPRPHYESYFVRANHPTEARAFWLRYTIFSPRGRPEETVGELWAIAFDERRGAPVFAKTVVPFEKCAFACRGLDVRVGAARLDERLARGEAGSGDRTIAWDLEIEPRDERPILLLPPFLYEAPVPRAKSIAPIPFARFRGSIRAGGHTIGVDGWMGSQNHNWGSAHTDSYAWGQVVGFDEAPDVFWECATARYRVGRFWTPPLTTAVLRLDGETLAFNTVRHAVTATASVEGTRWTLVTGHDGLRARATFEAAPGAFVELAYDNPPGGTKTCHNSKIASCELEVWRRGKPPLRLVTKSRAAFEMLR